MLTFDTVALTRFFTGVFVMKKHLFLFACFLLLLSSTVVLGEVVGDFDGDGKTDLTVRRRNHPDPQLYWYTLNSRNNQFSQAQWGYNPGNSTTSDLPALGDYDGDGKTDIAVFRRRFTNDPKPDYFFILRSGDSTMQAVQWGMDGDILIQQDYDGDGKTDIAVARWTAQTTWHILGSRDGYFTRTIPLVGVPVRGDYDGDGKADAAYVSSDSQYRQFFHILKSSTNQLQITQFGHGLVDYAVPGDYDGDGKTDIAVWRGKNETPSGVWYWIRSSDGNWGAVRFGTGYMYGDHPVAGDYDGDGKTDVAIWRRADDLDQQSYFYIFGSSRGFYGVPWGSLNDEPPVFWLR
jgi:hypothetical protein